MVLIFSDYSHGITQGCTKTMTLPEDKGHGKKKPSSGKKYESKILFLNLNMTVLLFECSAVQCSAVRCSAVQFSAVQCSAVQCSAVQFSAVQCSAVQCSAV